MLDSELCAAKEFRYGVFIFATNSEHRIGQLMKVLKVLFATSAMNRRMPEVSRIKSARYSHSYLRTKTTNMPESMQIKRNKLLYIVDQK